MTNTELINFIRKEMETLKRNILLEQEELKKKLEKQIREEYEKKLDLATQKKLNKLKNQFGIINEQGIILNYTPHTVNIIDLEGKVIQDFPSVGEIRCKQTNEQIGQINNIPISSTCFGEVIGLPKEQKGTYYIVSRLVKQACPSRQDLLVPNELVRNDKGQIIGCKSLANN